MPQLLTVQEWWEVKASEKNRTGVVFLQLEVSLKRASILCKEEVGRIEWWC